MHWIGAQFCACMSLDSRDALKNILKFSEQSKELEQSKEMEEKKKNSPVMSPLVKF